SDFTKKTTYPPLLVTSPITNATTWAPQAQRDTDGPDLGYHYDPLDYLITNVSLTASLTLTNGVAVGVYGNYGINLTSGSASLVSEGAPANLNRLTRYQTVQEQ